MGSGSAGVPRSARRLLVDPGRRIRDTQAFVVPVHAAPVHCKRRSSSACVKRARASFRRSLILKSGARSRDLPRDYSPCQTCHRRFQQRVWDGTITRALQTLTQDLRARGEIDIREAFIDGTFSSAKKGAFLVARQNAGIVQDHGHGGCSWSSNRGLP